MSLLIAFAGQGLQHGKMFAWLNTDSFGQRWLKDASNLLNLDLLDESAVSTACTDVVQVQCLITILSVGAFYALKKQTDLNPAFFCGYSLGETSAFCASANLSLAEIYALVATRAQFMQQAITQPSGMAVLKGNINFAQVIQLTKAHACYLAIINADDHYIIGGLLANLDALLLAAKNSGVMKAVKLAVKLPSHTPLLAQATVNFSGYLQQFATLPLRYPILNALTQELIFTSKEILPILAREISETLHWKRVLSIAKEYGSSFFLELGPGAALKNMALADVPQLKAYNMEGFRSVHGLAAFLQTSV
jgi:[acyl-carrier-protein] S-malonyltransferase